MGQELFTTDTFKNRKERAELFLTINFNFQYNFMFLKFLFGGKTLFPLQILIHVISLIT